MLCSAPRPTPTGASRSWGCQQPKVLRRKAGLGLQRAGVEGQFARWKQVIGDGLRFHSDEARATEVAIAAQVLNRMLDLGRPNSVRVA